MGKKYKVILTGIIGVLVVIGLWVSGVSLDDLEKPLPEVLGNDWGEFGSKTETKLEDLKGPYNVIRVVDGDTIVVNINSEQVKVRFIGVDTPESVSPYKEKNCDEGREASRWMKKLLDGSMVYIEYDVSPTDRFGRTLAYVYLPDGRTMVNRLLLQEGLAQVETVQPNSKYAEEFHDLQIEARENGKGFWKVL